MTPAEFRARFPMLERTVHLASCSLGARSVDLDAALTAMLDAMASPGMPWDAFEHEVSSARQRFADLIGAHPDRIAVLPNASVAAYQVASTVDWSRRPVLVACGDEFPSLSHVWQAQWPRGAEVVHADDHAAAITGRTALVSVPMTTYRTATRMPVREVADAAHAAGARVVVDAYQAAGVEPVRVSELDCDFLISGTLKYLLGLPGLAFLYVRPGLEFDRDPELTGWFGRVDPYAFDRRLDFPAQARRFETGTPAVPAAYAANAGLRLIGSLDADAVRAHVRELVSMTAARLVEAGERLRTPTDPDRRGAHVAVLDEDPAGLGAWLGERRIRVSPRGDAVRLSFHYYSNADDVEAVCAAIQSYRSGR